MPGSQQELGGLPSDSWAQWWDVALSGALANLTSRTSFVDAPNGCDGWVWQRASTRSKIGGEAAYTYSVKVKSPYIMRSCVIITNCRPPAVARRAASAPSSRQMCRRSRLCLETRSHRRAPRAAGLHGCVWVRSRGTFLVLIQGLLFQGRQCPPYFPALFSLLCPLCLRHHRVSSWDFRKGRRNESC